MIIDPLIERGLPHNAGAECATLGTVLVNNAVIDQASELLRVSDFYINSNRCIFEAMLNLQRQGMSIDLVTLKAELEERGIFERVGGATYIASLIDDVSQTSSIESYARILRKLSKKRERIAKANDEIARAYSEDDIELDERDSLSLVQHPPVIADPAFHGLAGEFVRLLEPETEADPVALLIQFLIAYGNVIGRSAHFLVEATIHYLNEFAVLVGVTGKSRKGTSQDRSLYVFERADADWREKCTSFGLSTGEGLIQALSTAADKRLLVCESEYARVLKVATREGNTLSTQLRQSWDSGEMRVMTRANPLSVTGAHVSIIAHITPEEILRLLSTTEAANGFANRFLWLSVRRSKFLPDGGRNVNLNAIVERLHGAIEFARAVGQMKRDAEARDLWHQVYPKLSEGQPGLLGAITSRAEAHVMRLACLYALLDSSATISRPHLESALALWDYAEHSARFIFGDRLGDPVADSILAALRGVAPDGMTRTEISAIFGRHRRLDEIARALVALAERDLAYSEPERTEGRSIERWFVRLVCAKKAKKAKEGYEQPNHDGLISHNSLISPTRETESEIPARYEDWI